MISTTTPVAAEKKPRIWQIDVMRGVSMMLMMVLHVLAYYKDDPVAFVIWEFAQLSVPVFIFCSAYLFYTRDAAHGIYGFSYYKKRLVRLLKPYYLFLVPYFILVWIFEPAKLTWSFIKGSMLLSGGVYINWLALLFLYLAALSSPLYQLYKRYKTLLIFWLIFALSFSVFTFSSPWPNWWRWGMWIGWSVLLPYSWYVSHLIQEKKQRLLLVLTVVGLLTTAALWYVRQQGGLSLEVTYSKYPPNLYYLSYAATMIPLAWFAAHWSVFRQQNVKAIATYFSKHSYPLFFIHFFVIFFLLYVLPTSKLHWAPYSILMFVLALSIQRVFTYLANKPIFKALR